MNIQQKIINSSAILIVFIFGLLVGRLWKNFPYLKFNPEINILDSVNLLVMVIIAFMIPIFITKLIEDKRGIKIILIDETRELISIISEIKNIISSAHSSGALKVTDKDDINFKFHEAELKANSILEQIKESFVNNSPEVQGTIKGLLWNYKDYLTGGELMHSSFIKVNQHFYRENITEYYKIETGLKTLIQKICKF